MQRAEFLFIGLGAAIGAGLAAAVQAGLFPPFDSATIFLAVVAPLGVVEVAMTYIRGQAPGTLVSMPSRIAALLLGIGIYFALRSGTG